MGYYKNLVIERQEQSDMDMAQCEQAALELGIVHEAEEALESLQQAAIHIGRSRDAVRHSEVSFQAFSAIKKSNDDHISFFDELVAILKGRN